MSPLSSFQDKQTLLEIGLEPVASFWLLKKFKRIPTQTLDFAGFSEEPTNEDDAEEEGAEGDEDEEENGDLLC